MVVLNEQVMLKILAKDNASNVARNIDSSFQGMASNISKAMSSISNSMMNFSAVSDNALQSLTGKSAMDNILGTSSKAETNKVLVKNMTETEEAYESLYETIDKTTDTSLTSMQELIPAMNAFKAATGASDKEIEGITGDMANFGAAVLAQTGSTELAQSAMMDLSKGIKGAFASLDQYGVSEDALKRTKLWSGKEDDVEGYMAAVTEVIGSTDELMETNEGLDAQIGKTFSRAGKKLGNEFLPIIKDVKRGFIELDSETGGALAGSILAVSGSVEVLNQGLWNVSTTVQGIRDLSDAFSSLKNIIKSTGKAAEATGDALNMGSNISQIGADVSSVEAISKETKDISGVKSFSQEIAEAAFFANSGFGNEKNTLKILDDAIDSQKKIGNKKLEYSEILKEVSKEDYGLTDAIKDFKSNKIESAEKLLENSGEKFQKSVIDFSGKPRKAGESIKKSFESFSESLKSIKDDGFKGNFKKIDKKLYQSLKSTSDTVDALESVADMGDGAGDAIKVVKGVDKVEDATETVVEGAGAIGALAPEAAAAGAEVEATAAASTTLSGAFTSMIVPLLAISAVIIIMLPIVAVIAAEAMVLLKLLGEFMESLDFGSLDLSSSVDGIKSIAEGLAWVGAAMAAMTFTSIMTGLAIMTSGFLGITTPLEVAKDALIKASNILKQFSSVNIDPSVVTNLKNISDGLKSVSDAMLALTSVTVTTGFSDFIAWAFQFRSVTDALEKAKTEIQTASTKLNELATGISPLDKDKANNIQNVCDSLASVGDAMSALRSMRDSQNWDNIFGDLMTGIFGEGLDIEDALDSVKGDIQKASKALSQWNNLEDIPEGVGEKIKKVSDTLTSVSESFENLRKLRDNTNWDSFVGGIFGGVDIATAITNIGSQIRAVSTRLASLSTIAWVDDSVSEKINKMGKTLGNMSTAISSMKSLPNMGDFDISTVNTAVTNVRNVANQLSTLSSITLGEDNGGVLGTIQHSLESLKTTLASASGFSIPATSIGTQIVNGVKSGLSPLTGMITGAVTNATGSAASAGWTGGARIGTSTTNGFKSALNLHSVMTTEMGYVKTAVDNGISAAKTAAQNGAEEVVEAFKSGINVGSPGDIARTMSGEMNYTLEAIRNMYSSLRSASNTAARYIVDSFGKPTLGLESSFDNFTTSQIGSLQTILSNVPNLAKGGNVTIIIGEGAVTVDARNKTEREAQQIMITALESMDAITDIKVTGA